MTGVSFVFDEHEFGAKHYVACQHSQQARDVDPMLVRCWSNASAPSSTLSQHQTSTGSTSRDCWAVCWYASGYCWRQVQAYTDTMSVKCWASVAGAGQYPFSPSQYSMLAVPARCFEPNLGYCWPAVCDAGPH